MKSRTFLPNPLKRAAAWTVDKLGLEDFTKRDLLSIPIAVFVALAFGALSFAGMYLLSSSWAWGSVVFVLAAAIEGEIFKQNISQAIDNLADGPVKMIKRAIAARELNDLLKSNCTLSAPDLKAALKKRQYKKILNTLKPEMNPEVRKFLELYFAKQTDLARLNKYKNIYDNAKDKKNLKIVKEAIKGVQRSIHDMQDFFITSTMQPAEKNYQSELETALRNQYAEKSPKFQREVRNKKIALAISGVCAVGAGIAQALVALGSSQAAFVALGLSAATSMTIIGPVAVIAAIGWGLMMYYNVTDIIQNDVVQRWYEKTKKYFHRRKDEEGKFKETKGQFLFRVTFGAIGVGLVVALATFATISTAGTWWVAAKQGAAMISWISNSFANALRAITVILMGPSILSFNTFNSLTSMEGIFKKIKTKWDNFKNHVKEAHHHHKDPNEPPLTFMQKLNPFRALYALAAVVLRSIIFIGHLISVGFTADQMPNVSPILSTVANAVAEGLQDYHYIFKSHNHSHSHAPNLEDKEEDLDEDLECGHKHTDVTSLILNFAFSPVILLGRMWDYAFANHKAPKRVHVEPAKHEVIVTTTDEAFKSTWQKQIVLERCRQQAHHLKSEINPIHNKTIAKNKIEKFDSIAYQLAHNGESKAEGNTPKTTLDLFAKNRNRLFDSKKPATSRGIFNEFINEDLTTKDEFKSIENDLIRVGLARGASAA